ncbi:MAG: DNA-processing protein DprA [Pseudohongiellaceae bacterium]
MLSHWLTLYHSRALAPGDWRRLLDRFGTPDAILGASADVLRAAAIAEGTAEAVLDAAAPGNPVREEVEADLEWLEQSPDHHLLTLADEGYPDLLKEIRPAPPVLYLVGQRERLCDRQIAVVGSRKSSPYGRDQAFELSAGLANCGITVTSGLAAGIDACAHRGALRAGGATVAVLGNGVDVVFPRSNRALYGQIREQGLLVSEFARGTPPRAEQFPRRNRIISGLSRGVVVVEGTVRSGSLITARLAMEQNREVLAVPGSVRNPQSRGCHQLLREGAGLAENAGDVLEQTGLAPDGTPAQDSLFRHAPPPVLPDSLQSVLGKITDDPVPIDQLVQRTGLTLSDLSRALLQLEIRGRISRNALGYCRQGPVS